MAKRVVMTTVSKDHIILERSCGCRLHVFIGNSFEEKYCACKMNEDGQGKK